MFVGQKLWLVISLYDLNVCFEEGGGQVCSLVLLFSVVDIVAAAVVALVAAV